MKPLKTVFAEALALHQAGRLIGAEALYREILTVLPDHPDSLHLLGVVARQRGRPAEALALIGRAIALEDGISAFHHNLAEVLRALGRREEAVVHYRRAIDLLPDWAGAHNHLGVALQELGRLDEAMACYRRALELDGDDADAHNNLGVALQDQGALGQAEACYRRALDLAPDDPGAGGNLANLLREQGRPDEAVACYRRQLEVRPELLLERADIHSNLMLALLGQPGISLAGIADQARRWEQCHAAGLAPLQPRHVSAGRPDRRPRLGFVSGDFRRHAVGFLTIAALEALAAAGQELVCYSNGVLEDALTARFQAAAMAWRPIGGLSDDEAAELIRADGIDILFDLSGHTASNRLLLFARKPAPIQIAWVGFPATTGLSAMDYLLADGHQVPPAAEPWYRERIIRLPASYICWEPPAEAPPVTALPAGRDRPITFGSFNFLSKLSPGVIPPWSRLLRRLPESRLVLKATGFACADTRQRLREQFSGQGIDPERLSFAGGSPRPDHLAAIGAVDIALDSFPYSGGLTTLEILWMGVPVITCPGDTLASRHAYGYLTTLGLGEAVAGSLDEYVDLAAAWAADRERLAGLRAGLRGRMLASPLCDAGGFAEALLEACRQVWERFRAGLPPCVIVSHPPGVCPPGP